MAVQAVNLDFGYKERNIILNCSFVLEKGKVYSILGPNGSGKTTILKLLNGTLKPRGGRVLVEGYDIRHLGKKRAARLMATLPQEHKGIFPYTVLDMVVMGRNPYLSFFGRPRKKDYHLAEEALHLLGLLSLKDRCYMEISGGERQMVFLARAIAQDASFFLMDEPTSHLDFFNQHQIMNILRRTVRKKGCSVIMAMHDPNLTLSFADEVLMLKKGRLMNKGQTLKVMTAENLSSLYGMTLKVVDLDHNKKCVVG